MYMIVFQSGRKDTLFLNIENLLKRNHVFMLPFLPDCSELGLCTD